MSKADAGLTRDGTAEPVSRDQHLRRKRTGQGNVYCPCSADHEQDWQPSTRLIHSSTLPSYYVIIHTYVAFDQRFS